MAQGHTLLFPWDIPVRGHIDMPLIEGVSQSNTVTQSVLINRVTGDVYPLVDGEKQERVRFSQITQTVQDLRFRSQRLLNLRNWPYVTSNRNTILISLTGVVVTTGARSIESALHSVVSTTRILNAYRFDQRETMCHANLKVIANML